MLKVVWNVLKRFFGIFTLIFSPLKRLWCRRKRRDSNSILPMTMATHYPSVENLSNGNAQEEMSPWDAWEDQSNKPRTVEQYRYYQQQAAQRQNSQEPEPEPDYFQDLTPSLTKQKKVLIRKKEEDHINTSAISSKLAVLSDVPLTQGADLGTWEDENNAWDNEGTEDLSWEAENVIREKRRAERQQRHLEQQRKKLEREQRQQHKGHNPHGQLAAMKLS